MKILFWDIDGTLLKTARAGLYAFQQASADILKAEFDFERIVTAGMTDYYIAGQIIKLITGRQGLPADIRLLVEHYEELLPSELEKRRGGLLPRVYEVLNYFHQQPGYRSLLLTGNTYKGAAAKLTSYGIQHFFDFEASAFGDNCLKRTSIASLAWQKARQKFPAVKTVDGYVIGDTPNDIKCGDAIGVRTIAVATGNHPADELSAHKPWLLLNCLPAPAEFKRLLGS